MEGKSRFYLHLLFLQVVISEYLLSNKAAAFAFTGNHFINLKSAITNECRFNLELNAITKSQAVILDGSSLNTLHSYLVIEGISTGGNIGPSNSNDRKNVHGYCSIVTAKTKNNERFIGILADKADEKTNHLDLTSIDDNVHVYTDSLATIPNFVSDEDAISTCAASLVGVHCSMHNPVPANDKIVQNIGGSDEVFESSVETEDEKKKNIIVVGGGDYASFVADGLAAVGVAVTQVSTNKLLRNRGQVSVTTPAVGQMGLGFASVVGKFDALVDTLSDESKAGESMCIGLDNEWDDFDTSDEEECSSAVIMELKRQHKCNRYISTMSNAQKMVRDNGLIFGRSDAQGYMKQIIANKPAQRKIFPPKQFGSKTLQKILDANVIYKQKNKDSSLIQGWTMGDYWELTSWPRDVAGAANVRFGFPVIDDLNSIAEDDDSRDDIMISAPPKSINSVPPPKPPRDQFEGENNPYVMNIDGIDELSSKILKPEKLCVLFLSSSSCRTCKYLTPKYTQLSIRRNDGVVFAKANAFGKKGKELSKVLGVNAVPAFVLFRDGQVYGKTITLTKLPSKKLNLALELLTSGDE